MKYAIRPTALHICSQWAQQWLGFGGQRALGSYNYQIPSPLAHPVGTGQREAMALRPRKFSPKPRTYVTNQCQFELSSKNGVLPIHS